MNKFWQNDAIVWSEGIKQMDLVIKDNSGGGGHAHKRHGPGKVLPDQGADHDGPGLRRLDIRSEPGSRSADAAKADEAG